MTTGPVHPPTRPPRPRAVWAGLCLALFVGGCGGDERGPYPIEPGRERERPSRPVPPNASTAGRFGLGTPEPTATLAWDLPEGWTEQPPAQMSVATFRVTGEGGGVGEVTVSRAGGSVADNVNRWRKSQMNLPEATPEEIAALPKRTLLGQSAVLADLKGEYTPRATSEKRPDHRMLALVLVQGGENVFVKFVGPRAVVDKNEAAFERFVASVREVTQVHDGDAEPKSPEPPRAPTKGLDPRKIGWTLPEGWTDAKPSGSFRVRDFRIAAAPNAVSYLSLLQGNGGGLEANVSLWRGQMGAKEALDARAVDALERLDVMGVKAVFVEQAGDFQGMSGESVPDAVFYGVIVPLEDDTLFLRLVGPRAQVEPQREAFRALARSLRLDA